MGKVIQFSGLTIGDIDPDHVLESAKGQLETCMVLGFDKEGKFYAANSHSDVGMMLWLMLRLKRMILENNVRLAEEYEDYGDGD